MAEIKPSAEAVAKAMLSSLRAFVLPREHTVLANLFDDATADIARALDARAAEVWEEAASEMRRLRGAQWTIEMIAMECERRARAAEARREQG